MKKYFRFFALFSLTTLIVACGGVKPVKQDDKPIVSTEEDKVPPSVVTGFQYAHDTGRLTWGKSIDASEPITYYVFIFEPGDAEDTSKLEDAEKTTETQITYTLPSGVEEAHAYVVAEDAKGLKSTSEKYVIKKPSTGGALKAPLNLQYKPETSELSWDESQGGTSPYTYQVFKKNGTAAGTPVTQAFAAARKATVVQSNTEDIEVYVVVKDAAGATQTSATRKIPKKAAPAPRSLVAPVPTVLGNTITWPVVDGAESYEVKEGGSVKATINAGQTLSYDAGASSADRKFTVTAKKGAESAESAEVTVKKTGNDIIDDNVITPDIRTVAPSDGVYTLDTKTLTWKAPAGFAGNADVSYKVVTVDGSDAEITQATGALDATVEPKDAPFHVKIIAILAGKESKPLTVTIPAKEEEEIEVITVDRTISVTIPAESKLRVLVRFVVVPVMPREGHISIQIEEIEREEDEAKDYAGFSFDWEKTAAFVIESDLAKGAKVPLTYMSNDEGTVTLGATLKGFEHVPIVRFTKEFSDYLGLEHVDEKPHFFYLPEAIRKNNDQGVPQKVSLGSPTLNLGKMHGNGGALKTGTPIEMTKKPCDMYVAEDIKASLTDGDPIKFDDVLTVENLSSMPNMAYNKTLNRMSVTWKKQLLKLTLLNTDVGNTIYQVAFTCERETNTDAFAMTTMTVSYYQEGQTITFTD